MNDGIVVTLGLTAREVDLMARLHFEAWEGVGFAVDSFSLDVLVALRHEVPEHMPDYVRANMETRGV